MGPVRRWPSDRSSARHSLKTAVLTPVTSSPSATPCTCPSQTEMLLTFTTLRDVCSNRSLSKERENVPKLFVNVAKRVSATSAIHIVPRHGGCLGSPRGVNYVLGSHSFSKC